jgi:hypothetical protein
MPMLPGIDSLPLRRLPPGPVAIVLAEDGVALPETIARCRTLGFAATLLLGEPRLALPPAEGLHQAAIRLRSRTDVAAALTRLNSLLAGRWLYWGFTAEFLFYPFCETRSVRDLIAFMEEERRAAVFTGLLDLYPGDLAAAPSGVDLESAWFDGSGRFGLASWEDGAPVERRIDHFGGLAWRFEEHLPPVARRTDRVSLYRAEAGLAMREDFRLGDPERNTHQCVWHRNVTACLASFRTARALRRTPASAAAIAEFRWACSRPFGWSSAELLDQGFMESGQWF